MNWGRPIRAWSNPFGDLYGRGPPGGGGRALFFWRAGCERRLCWICKRQPKLSTWKVSLQSEKLQPFQPSTLSHMSHMSPCRSWLFQPSTLVGHCSLDPRFISRPSISCACWCFDQGQGISVDCCGVTWSCQKIPKKIQGLEASSGIAGKLFDDLMLVIPECATEWPLEVVCVVWNFLLREAIFSCPRVETTSRRQAGTGFQGINCSYPIQGQVLRIVTRGWPVSGPSDGNRSPASRQ